MTDTQKATPRPWHLDKKAVIKRTVFDARQQIVVICQSDAGDCEANAALIVTAVNAFDAMREALRLALHGLDTNGPASAAATLNVQGRAALAAAEGKADG